MVVNSKSLFSRRGFQTQTSRSIKRINTHPVPTGQNENNSSIEGKNGEKLQNVLGFLQWKISVESTTLIAFTKK